MENQPQDTKRKAIQSQEPQEFSVLQWESRKISEEELLMLSGGASDPEWVPLFTSQLSKREGIKWENKAM